ncbi:MAG TPA: hypothetical protein VIS05_11370 [Ilumatobacter sp.]
MDPITARKTWRTLEPIHAMIYFVPEASERYRTIGIADQSTAYFASRAAPLGEVSAETVIAAFFVHNPDSVRAAIPMVWQEIRPEELVAARLMAADAALRRLLGGAIHTAELAAAAELARAAALAACDRLEGRPLFAANAGLAWPSEPHLVLWHAQTLLREFRGDGHISALVTDDITGIEALVMHGGTGDVSPEVQQAFGYWPDDAWTAAVDRLIDRGLLLPDGRLSPLGVERRQWVEDRTDVLALAPYQAIGEDGCDELRQLARPLSRAIVDGGGVPG